MLRLCLRIHRIVHCFGQLKVKINCGGRGRRLSETLVINYSLVGIGNVKPVDRTNGSNGTKRGRMGRKSSLNFKHLLDGSCSPGGGQRNRGRGTWGTVRSAEVCIYWAEDKGMRRTPINEKSTEAANDLKLTTLPLVYPLPPPSTPPTTSRQASQHAVKKSDLRIIVTNDSSMSDRGTGIRNDTPAPV